jgi:hypothetical protein
MRKKPLALMGRTEKPGAASKNSGASATIAVRGKYNRQTDLSACKSNTQKKQSKGSSVDRAPLATPSQSDGHKRRRTSKQKETPPSKKQKAVVAVDDEESSFECSDEIKQVKPVKLDWGGKEVPDSSAESNASEDDADDESDDEKKDDQGSEDDDGDKSDDASEEDGSRSDCESSVENCTQCLKSLLPGQPRYRTMLCHHQCGLAHRSAVNLLQNDKKKLAQFKGLKHKDPRAYARCIIKMGASELAAGTKSSSLKRNIRTPLQLKALNEVLEEVGRVKKMSRDDGKLLLDKEEYIMHMKNTRGWKKTKAQSHWTIAKQLSLLTSLQS